MVPFELPEYCAEICGAARPLMLVRVVDEQQARRISSLLQGRISDCQSRVFLRNRQQNIAFLGAAGCATDQFFRSLIYVLQEACPDDRCFPEVLETRLVPERFVLCPEQKRGDSKSGNDLLVSYGLILQAEGAFGSGFHPSTRLAAKMLKKIRHDGHGFPAEILDIGCGSGILALICAKLGAAKVTAVDRDLEAVAAARRNIAANSLDSTVTAVATPVVALTASYKLVVANLTVSVLHALFDHLHRLTAVNGLLVVSGFQKNQTNILLQKAAGRGYSVLNSLSEGSWQSLLFRKGEAQGDGANILTADSH
jgi:protein-L-isoaspartate O-methyltransferase